MTVVKNLHRLDDNIVLVPNAEDKGSNHVSTLSMVVTLVSMVFGVFLCFAFVSVYCYRYAPRHSVPSWARVGRLGQGWAMA